MVKAYPNYFANSVGLWIESIFTNNKNEKSIFNEYGDICIERPNSTDNVFGFDDNPSITYADEYYIESINKLNEYLESKGATLLIAGYPIGYSGEVVEESLESLLLFTEDLSERLNCTVISDYRDYLFSYDYFYNTSLHLTDEGAIIRTQLLINDLTDWMQEQSQ